MEVIILIAVIIGILSAIKAPKSLGGSRRLRRSTGKPGGLPWFDKRKH